MSLAWMPFLEGRCDIRSFGHIMFKGQRSSIFTSFASETKVFSGTACATKRFVQVAQTTGDTKSKTGNSPPSDRSPSQCCAGAESTSAAKLKGS